MGKTSHQRAAGPGGRTRRWRRLVVLVITFAIIATGGAAFVLTHTTPLGAEPASNEPSLEAATAAIRAQGGAESVVATFRKGSDPPCRRRRRRQQHADVLLHRLGEQDVHCAHCGTAGRSWAVGPGRTGRAPPVMVHRERPVPPDHRASPAEPDQRAADRSRHGRHHDSCSFAEGSRPDTDEPGTGEGARRRSRAPCGFRFARPLACAAVPRRAARRLSHLHRRRPREGGRVGDGPGPEGCGSRPGRLGCAWAPP